MQDQNIIKFYFSFLCLITLSVCYESTHAAASSSPVAQVILVTGSEFKATQLDKTERSLTRRSPIFQGDVLSTGANTTAQIRFQDDAVLAFQNNTKISIDEYRAKETGSTQDKSVSTLIKGGFRTITGKIAERNPDNYQVKTPVAIIGVRGTNYSAFFDKNDLFVTVWQGQVNVQNSGGLIQLSSNKKFKNAIISNNNIAPQGLVSIPKQISGNTCSQ